MDLVELFTKGGPVMYVLLLTSIAVAVIGIERFRFYNYAGDIGENFLNNLKASLGNNDLEAGLAICSKEDNSVAQVARSGIEAAYRGENVEMALTVAHDDIAMRLRARLNYLSMIVTLAPLLGLLGTISGMIESFNIFSIQAGQPLAITGGIGEALIATATGLCVAIFALIVHTYFAQKLDEKLADIEKTATIVQGSLSWRNTNA